MTNILLIAGLVFFILLLIILYTCFIFSGKISDKENYHDINKGRNTK